MGDVSEVSVPTCDSRSLESWGFPAAAPKRCFGAEVRRRWCPVPSRGPGKPGPRLFTLSLRRLSLRGIRRIRCASLILLSCQRSILSWPFRLFGDFSPVASAWCALDDNVVWALSLLSWAWVRCSSTHARDDRSHASSTRGGACEGPGVVFRAWSLLSRHRLRSDPRWGHL